VAARRTPGTLDAMTNLVPLNRRQALDLALGCAIFGAPVLVVVGAAIWVMPRLQGPLLLRVIVGVALFIALAAIWGIIFAKLPISHVPTAHYPASLERHDRR
jgi:hypothetical protein